MGGRLASSSRCPVTGERGHGRPRLYSRALKSSRTRSTATGAATGVERVVDVLTKYAPTAGMVGSQLAPPRDARGKQRRTCGSGLSAVDVREDRCQGGLTRLDLDELEERVKVEVEKSLETVPRLVSSAGKPPGGTRGAWEQR